MRYQILIPSRGRSHLIGTVGSTINQFDSELRRATTYFVPPEEVDSYRRKLPDEVTVVGISYDTIGEKRHKMVQQAASDRVFMVDDDLRWFTRENIGSTKLERSSAADLHRMLGTTMLFPYAVVGISAREGNNRIGVGIPEVLLQLNTRIYRAAMFNRKKFLSVEHGRVQYMEDFDVLLQLLRRGEENVNLYYWCHDQGRTQASGGCSIHRTHETHEQAVRRLAELHPGLVKVVEKENKTGGSFGKRVEVVISWKRALRQP